MQPQLFVRTSSVLFPVPDFAAVEEYRDGGMLKALAVELAGLMCVCDLETAALHVGEECYQVVHPGAPLRPIYYKQMSCESGAAPHLDFVALGWQTTVNGANVRFGVKLYPDEGRWELGSDL